MRSRTVVVAWGIAALLSACGDDSVPEADAGVDAAPDAGVGPTPPAPPAEPMPPMLPCPGGWVSDGAEPPSCLPWAPDAPDCAPSEVRFVGEGCAVLAPCVDDFAPDLPAGAVYVAPGGTGDGSRDRPLGRIRDAVTAAGPGGVVALGRGRFDEAVVLDQSVTLIGACPAETILTFSFAGGAVMRVHAGDVSLQRVTVTGSGVFGLQVAGGSLDAQEVVTEGTEALGWFLQAGAVVTGRRLVFRDIHPLPDGSFGRAVELQEGARADLRQVMATGLSDNAFAVLHAGSDLALSDALVSGVVEGRDGVGRALTIELGGSASLTNVLVEDVRETAFAVSGTGSALSLHDFAVRDVEPRADGQLGLGVIAQAGASVEMARGSMVRTHRAALQVSGESSTLTIEDLVIREVRPQVSDSTFGRGLLAALGSQVTARRVHVEETVDAAVLVADEGTHLAAVDLRIVDVAESPMGGSRGVVLALGATLDVERLSVERAGDVAVLVAGAGTRMTTRDLVIRDTAGDELTGLLGYGVHVIAGAEMSASRTRIERARAAAVVIGGEGSRCELLDLIVEQTLERRCAEDLCRGAAAGIGLSSIEAGWLRAERFEVVDGALVGVQVARGGNLFLTDGLVARNPIGANVQVAGYDLSRIQDRVYYRDNGVTLDASEVTVPDPSSAGSL